MSRQNSALASLTATYTDTDSEPEEDEDDDSEEPHAAVEILSPKDSSESVVSESKADQMYKSNEPRPIPMVIDEGANPEQLVSYSTGKEDQIDDEAIDDYDFYRDSRNASEEEDQDTKSIESPMDSADSQTSKKEETIQEETADQELVKKKSKLPSAPTASCSEESQRIVNKMFESKIKRHLDVNKYIQSNKSFRNPSIYEKLIEFCNIDELGTNYPPEVFNPHEWPESSYYDELAKAQKTEMDRREKARRERVKVEIVSGVGQKKLITLPTAVSASISTAVAVGQGMNASSALSKEPEKRKSKWDQRN